MSVTESTADEAEGTYDRLRDAVEEYGEVMVRTTSGEELELHTHNVSFDPEEPFLRIDADGGTHWFDASTVERYWIHDEL